METGETHDKKVPPLQIDPKCFQDALRTFFQPIKNDDPRLDFYTMYRREATEYDIDYVKKFDEDLNTTLIFAGLFSAVSSAFVIDVYSKLQPDPNDQSAALLRAILLTLNHSAIPNESPVAPPVQQYPPSEIVTATGLLYASLLISLLAAFVAMLGKQWLNRYLRHAGGSMVERCGDRQRKHDGLQKWPFHMFVESLPVMLQIALLLLTSGICRYMVSINTPIAYSLITLTGLGVVFYIGIVIAGASSYECPFQTPGSVPLRSLWAKVRPYFIPAVLPIATALRTLGVAFWSCILNHLSLVGARRQFKTIQRGLLRLLQTGLNICRSSHHSHLPTTQEMSLLPGARQTIPWFAPNELVTIQTRNSDDVRCVSWVLRNITDPEALDAAIRLAGTIRWFEDGIHTGPPYGIIVSTFHACFGSDRGVYPASRDRAYHSGRAILWIHTLAVCKSEEFASMFPLPNTQYTAPTSDHDLTHILCATRITGGLGVIYSVESLPFGQGVTPSHLEWMSNLLLHLSWAVQAASFDINPSVHFTGDLGIPLGARLNCFLACCNLLGSPVGEEVLKIEDKSDRLEQTINQVSRAIISTGGRGFPQLEPTRELLLGLTELETRPFCLTELAYEWCPVIWESFGDWECLFLRPLEIGFRHLDSTNEDIPVTLTHVRHNQNFLGAVFETNRSDAIADLLQALTIKDRYGRPAWTSLSFCTRHITDLHNNVTVPFSPRLRQLVTRSIGCIGREGLRKAGPGKLVELFNHLHIGVKDLPALTDRWPPILVDIIQSAEGVRYLAIHVWELLAELTTSGSWTLGREATYDPQVTEFLLGTQEWGKLECWLGVVWMAWLPEADDMAEDLNRATNSLFLKKPDAVLKLKQWMEQCGTIPASFQRACDQVQLDALPSPPPHGRVEGSPHLSPSTQSLPFIGKKFLELLPLI